MSDILSALSILLAIITYYYDKTVQNFSETLKKQIPPEDQGDARKKLYEQISRDINKGIPFSIVYILFVLLLIPNTVSIILSSNIDIKNIDLPNTIFVILNIVLTIFAFNSSKYLGKLISRKRKLKGKVEIKKDRPRRPWLERS
jgi:hypothetical protein